MSTHIATTTTVTTRPAPSRQRPRLADDVELIGEYKNSGFRDPPYIVQRGKSVIQLTRLLYLVAAASDGSHDLEQIAEQVSSEFGRPVSARNVALLLERKLRPLGLLEGGEAPPGRDAPLALTARAAVVPESIVGPVAALFRPLFAPFVVGIVLAWVGALDVWLVKNHGLHEGIVQILQRPIFALLILALLLLSTIFHEIGHAAACRYGGARPGAMGIGFYLIWPAFYTDVTDAYRLNRRGRLRTDLGGVYFNCAFVIGLAGLYFWTQFEPLLVAIAIQHVQILNQFMPWARLDGYYVLTDLTGVPDILSRIKPILRSLIPDREPEPRVAELKPWVRAAVTIYVVTFVVASTFVLGLLVWLLPRYLGTAWYAIHRQGAAIGDARERHDFPAAALAVVQLAILLFPLIGITIGFVRTARSAGRNIRRRRRLRLAVAFAVVAALGALGSLALAGSPSPGIAAAHKGEGHFPLDEQAATPQARHLSVGRPTIAPQATSAGTAVPQQQPAAGMPSTAVPGAASAQPAAPAGAPMLPPGAAATPPPAPGGAAPGAVAAPPAQAPPAGPTRSSQPPRGASPPVSGTSTTAPSTSTSTGTTSTTEARPAAADTTTIVATPAAIDADGNSRSTITVQARDSSGTDLTVSGGRVALTASRGSLGPVQDNNNGTYTAILISSIEPGTAHVTGTIAGRPILDDASVEFIPVATTTTDTGTSTTTSTTTSIATTSTGGGG